MNPLRERLHEIIFEADTPLGKAFDIVLLIAIFTSVLCVMLETVSSIQGAYHEALEIAEWGFTILFTIEYALRLFCVRRPIRYARSFFGVVDLLAVIPTYLSVLFPGAQSLLVIRALRLIRVFRVFKLARFLSEEKALRHALWVSRAKITVFLTTVLIIVTIMGSAMYLVEGPYVNSNEPGVVHRADSPFTSIPQSVYWAVVTMTTVGYGDITPRTPAGKMITVIVVILGYSLIIIPTGIISAEMAMGKALQPTTQACPSCSLEGHEHDALHCKFCGTKL